MAKSLSPIPSRDSLTFFDDLQDDLPCDALEVWGIAHLTAEGAVKVELDVEERDGGILFHDVPWPHCVAFEAALSRRERALLVVEHLKEMREDEVRTESHTM